MPLEDHEDLQLFLETAEKRPGERVLGVFTYRPASTLIITNQRLIGKTGSNRGTESSMHFQGDILYGDIDTIEYRPGMPLVGSPALQIKHRLPNGEAREDVLQFPGGLVSLFVYRLSGFDPKQVYDLILEQYTKKR